MIPPLLASDLLAPLPHGFFTREGGVSEGEFASLNCSLNSGDEVWRLAENRARVAAALGVAPACLLGLRQVHGTHCVRVEKPWAAGEGPQADAMATRIPGLALGIITADCAPVLFADPVAGVVGAAHAGWRGAVAGILEETVAAMASLGAEAGRLVVAIGPCIGPGSYEVGLDLRDAVLAAGGVAAEDVFAPGRRPDHFQFDLPGYCLARLRAAGVQRAAWIGRDTLPDEARFFSHRRRTLAGGGRIGHQISAITCRRAA